jgi:hypothetical protein
MAKAKNSGICRFCLKETSGGQMSRHLGSCKAKVARDAQLASEGRRKGLDRIFHLRIAGESPYWLHVETKASSTLAELDAFLRQVWLECCGHLSEFDIGGRSYQSDTNDYGIDEPAESLATPLHKTLSVGDQFFYVYDFGTATELEGRVVAERQGILEQAVDILARNDPPEYSCSGCEETAAYLRWECGEIFCEACLAEDECGEQESALPLVNSPRAGECAYDGAHDPDDWVPPTG